VSPFTEVELITRRELRRSFRSAKGVILALLSVAGGAAVSVLLAWVDRARRERVPPEIEQGIRENLFVGMYGDATGHSLLASPYPLWLVLVGTLWLSPLLVVLMNFDAVSGDLQHRSVRFWTVRVRRSTYMLGKYLASWISVLAVMLGMNVIVWGVMIAAGHFAPGLVLAWGVRFFAVLIPIAAAWCAIAMLIGSQFKTPMLSLLVTCAGFFVLWLLRVIGGYAHADVLAYLYPSFYDAWLLSPNGSEVAAGLGGTVAITLLSTVAGTLLFQRRDV
jgi:ABC-type transport system involved in multi-copper enzyme maturation permease subunit